MNAHACVCERECMCVCVGECMCVHVNACVYVQLCIAVVLNHFNCLQIGQFLMTLPQHLEPFTLEDNPAVLVALKYGKLPYTDETGEFLSDLGGLFD